jgi:hypothetical protein
MTLKGFFLFVAFCFIPTSLFSNKLYFPQVSFGGGSTTTIILMNAGMAPVSSELKIFAQTGDLLRSIPTTVPGGGSTRLSIADPGRLIIRSWGVLDAGTETVKGVATIEMRSIDGTLNNRAGMFGVEGASDFAFPVDVTGDGLSNAVFAMANGNDQSALTVNLQLMSENGIGSPFVTGGFAKAIVLGPKHGITALITDFWPQIAVGFRGTLLIWVSSGPPNSLVLTALNVKEGVLSPVPAISGAVNSCQGCWDY